MTQYQTIINSFKEIGTMGMTRAEAAFLLFDENSQHLVCRSILDGIRAGILKETEVRRSHPVKGKTGKVVVFNGDVK